MSARTNSMRPAAKPDVAFLARRTVVAVASAAALVGILAGRPVLSVAWRAGVLALIALLAIRLVERFAPRSQGGTR